MLIIRERNSEIESERVELNDAPTGAVSGRPTPMSKGKDANLERSASDSHFFSKIDSTSPVSSRIGLKFAI
jgi:hypothetical protein